jgi:hypothetical protein
MARWNILRREVYDYLIQVCDEELVKTDASKCIIDLVKEYRKLYDEKRLNIFERVVRVLRGGCM